MNDELASSGSPTSVMGSTDIAPSCRDTRHFGHGHDHRSRRHHHRIRRSSRWRRDPRDPRPRHHRDRRNVGTADRAAHVTTPGDRDGSPRARPLGHGGELRPGRDGRRRGRPRIEPEHHPATSRRALPRRRSRVGGRRRAPRLVDHQHRSVAPARRFQGAAPGVRGAVPRSGGVPAGDPGPVRDDGRREDRPGRDGAGSTPSVAPTRMSSSASGTSSSPPASRRSPPWSRRRWPVTAATTSTTSRCSGSIRARGTPIGSPRTFREPSPRCGPTMGTIHTWSNRNAFCSGREVLVLTGLRRLTLRCRHGTSRRGRRTRRLALLAL